MSIWNKTFLKALGERALATFLQAFIAAAGVSLATGVVGVAWLPVLSVALGATVLSVAKGIVAGLQNGSPGFGDQEVLSKG